MTCYRNGKHRASKTPLFLRFFVDLTSFVKSILGGRGFVLGGRYSKIASNHPSFKQLK